MRIKFLGTGTSQGVPLIGCNCAVCTSDDKRDKRLRSSVWVGQDDVSMVIDTGPDFRYQMLRSKTHKLDAVLFTHGHKDHTAGLDDVRAYNYTQKKAMDVFATEETQQIIRREFAYIFNNAGYPGIPQLNIHTISAQTVFDVHGVKVTPIRVLHYELEVLGFRIGDFTYITDANFIAEEEIEKIKGSKIVVLNALRHEKHVSHFSLQEAIDISKRIGAEKTYFTHISHQLGRHEEIQRTLPENIFLAYDELELEIA